MDVGTIALFILVGIFVLLVAGVHLGFATGLLGSIVILVNFGWPGATLIAQRVYDLTTTYALVAALMFIVMASLLERSGIARDMYSALNLLLGRIRGGVAIVTTVMAVIMAAMSGIIGGEIVLLGLVALPQMLRLGYDKHLAIGTICAGGSLGTMIPPSIVLIIFGLITETSITALFTAAFIPGLMLAASYIIYIMIIVRLKPEVAPMQRVEDVGESEHNRTELLLTLTPFAFGAVALVGARAGGFDGIEQIAWFIFVSAGVGMVIVTYLRNKEDYPIARGLLPPLIVVDVVLGSIYGGVSGITEAAAMGAVSTAILIVIRREMSLKMILQGMDQTFRSIGAILWVTFGATVLAGAFSLSGGNAYVADTILGLDVAPIVVILVMMLIFLILGMFMDWIGIVLLTMPVFMPIVKQLGLDPVWFGILFCVNMQVSFLTPPFGPAAFYLKSVTPPEIDLVTIYRSFWPFIFLQLMVLTVLLLVPEISLFLVR